MIGWLLFKFDKLFSLAPLFLSMAVLCIDPIIRKYRVLTKGVGRTGLTRVTQFRRQRSWRSPELAPGTIHWVTYFINRVIN